MATNNANKFSPERPVTPFSLAVENNDIPGYSAVNKFGYNSNISTSEEDIWAAGGTYSFISTAGTATVTSSNTGDDNDGIVTIQGLDSNYNEVSATAVIGGSATTQTFQRINRCFLSTAETGSTNSGNITVTVDSTTAAYIPAGYAQTLQAIYTVPAGKTGFIIDSIAGVSEKEKEALLSIRVKYFGSNVFRTVQFHTFQTNFNQIMYPAPIKVTEKSDIKLTAKFDGVTGMSGGFQLYLRENN